MLTIPLDTLSMLRFHLHQVSWQSGRLFQLMQPLYLEHSLMKEINTFQRLFLQLIWAEEVFSLSDCQLLQLQLIVIVYHVWMFRE